MAESGMAQQEKKHRRLVVSQLLGRRLCKADMQSALQICDEDIATDHESGIDNFCRRLIASIPDVELGKQTRLLFLHQLQDPVGLLDEPSDYDVTFPQPADTDAPEAVTSNGHDLQIGERRRQARKTTHIVGAYYHAEQSGEMVVEDLSQEGARLNILNPHDLKKGETIRLEFSLDDAYGTVIRATGRVRWTLHETIGVQFLGALGFPQVFIDYLQS